MPAVYQRVHGLKNLSCRTCRYVRGGHFVTYNCFAWPYRWPAPIFIRDDQECHAKR